MRLEQSTRLVALDKRVVRSLCHGILALRTQDGLHVSVNPSGCNGNARNIRLF